MTTPEIRFPDNLDYWLASDTVLELGALGTVLQRTLTGAAITLATVTGEIWNEDAGPPAVKLGDITFSHAGSPDGRWVCSVADDFASSGLTRGMNVTTRITVDDGADFRLYAEIPGKVQVYRGEET